jgi:hypothetical protein
MITIGTKVECRGVFAREWSLVGYVEEIWPDGMCGVRLTNGNYKLVSKERVRPAS